MKLRIVITLLVVPLVLSCAPQIGGYNFLLKKPSNTLQKHTFDASSMKYDDEQITIKFDVSKTWYMNDFRDAPNIIRF